MKCLSVRNPLSYLLCCGVKDVENRSWKLNFSSDEWLYIHSSGLPHESIFKRNLPDKLQKELNKCLKNYKIDNDFNVIIDDKIKYKDIFKKIIELDIRAFKYQKYKKEYFYHAKAIIGRIKIKEIIKNSKSIWAEKNQYNIVIDKYELFDYPILNVRGKLKIFNYKEV